MLGIRYLGNTHIPHYKKTASLASIDLPTPSSILLPMLQHIGAPATPVVSPGDTVKVGQKVIFSKYSGTEVKLEDEEFIVVKQNDILAIVE